MKQCLILFLVLLVSTISHAQSTWYMDLPGFDFGAGCAATYDGGVATVSYLDSRIYKLDDAGSVQWIREIDSSDFQFVTGLAETADHGIVVMGSTPGFAATVIIKVDENGAVLWQKRYNAAGGNLTARWICPSHVDGGFLIGGGECAMQDYILRCDANGDIVWQQQYTGITGTAPTGSISTVTQAQGSGYFVTYGTLDNGDLDWGILKIDDVGTPLWAKSINEGTERDEVIAAVATQAGGVAVLGTTTNYQAPNSENKMTLTVLDANGLSQAYRVYDYTEQLQPHAIAATNDGGFVMVGSTFSLESMVVKTDGMGNIQWSMVNAGASTQEAIGAATAAGDMFYMSAHDFSHKATVAKISAVSGQGLCSATPLSLASATHTAPTTAPSVGTFVGSATAVTVNYTHHDATQAASVICTFVAQAAALPDGGLAVSPNPFAGSLRVSLGQSLSADAPIALYNLQGQRVAQATLFMGHNTLDWQFDALPDGLYLLQVEGVAGLKPVKVLHQKR